MPFGNVFGGFFFLFCAWLGLRSSDAGGSFARAGGFLLALLGLALALALFTRRPWARWAGLAAAAAMVLYGGWQVDARGNALDFAVVLAALVTAVLLTLPATAVPAARPAPAGGFGRVLGWTTALSALGLALMGATTFVAREPVAVAAERAPALPAGLDQHVRWSDFGSGVEQARAEGKPLLVTFETSWCGFCKKMDQTTWRDPAVVQRLNDLVPVKVNTEDGRTLEGFSGVQLAGQYQVDGTPTTMVVDADGRVLARTSGYQDARQFLSWLDGSLGRGGATNAGRIRTSAP